jgi:hypothetical protein
MCAGISILRDPRSLQHASIIAFKKKRGQRSRLVKGCFCEIVEDLGF